MPWSRAAFDSFDRADNASSLGTSDSGHTWVQQNGTWGIYSNGAYLPTGASPKSYATIDIGSINQRVQCSLVSAINSQSLIGRYADNNNVILMTYSSTFATWAIVKYVGGVATNLVNTGFSGVGQAAAMTIIGTEVKAWLKFSGAWAVYATTTISDAGLQTGTKVGIGMNTNASTTTAQRWDDWQADYYDTPVSMKRPNINQSVVRMATV